MEYLRRKNRPKIFSFFSKENGIFFILPEKCLVSSSLVPPMILLTKLDEALMLNGIIMVLSSSLVRRHKGGAWEEEQT